MQGESEALKVLTSRSPPVLVGCLEEVGAAGAEAAEDLNQQGLASMAWGQTGTWFSAPHSPGPLDSVTCLPTRLASDFSSLTPSSGRLDRDLDWDLAGLWVSVGSA